MRPSFRIMPVPILNAVQPLQHRHIPGVHLIIHPPQPDVLLGRIIIIRINAAHDRKDPRLLQRLYDLLHIGKEYPARHRKILRRAQPLVGKPQPHDAHRRRMVDYVPPQPQQYVCRRLPADGAVARHPAIARHALRHHGAPAAVIRRTAAHAHARPNENSRLAPFQINHHAKLSLPCCVTPVYHTSSPSAISSTARNLSALRRRNHTAPPTPSTSHPHTHRFQRPTHTP